ncbi:MAG: AAA family ATPase [Nanoarchaeota archaeon]
MMTSIILSGLPLSGKTTLAKKLSEMYHWPIYAIGQIWRDEWKEKYPKGNVSFEEF